MFCGAPGSWFLGIIFGPNQLEASQSSSHDSTSSFDTSIHPSHFANLVAKCEGWIEVLKEEVESFDEDREALKLIRTENYRLGTMIQERHKTWLQARNDLNVKVHEMALAKMNWLTVIGQAIFLGLAIHSMNFDLH